MLETIEMKLLQINEAFLLKEIDEATFAFRMHDALAKLPTPAFSHFTAVAALPSGRPQAWQPIQG